MNQEDYKKIKDAIDSAQDSVVPFPVMDGDELAVVGDANETQLNMHDFTMHFKVPVEDEGKRKIVVKEVEYKDIYVTPRLEPKIEVAIAELLPYFRKIRPDGSVGDFTHEEVYQLLDEMSQEIFDKMYALVGSFLGVDKSLWDYMSATDVFEAVFKIFSDYKEVANAADTFLPNNRS